jgi:hypothetical protein
MNQNTRKVLAQVLEFVKTGSDVLRQAEIELNDAKSAAKIAATKQAADQTKNNALAEKVASVLISAKMVRAEDEQAVRAKLASHEGTLELLNSTVPLMQNLHVKAAGHKKASGSMGVPADKPLSVESTSRYGAAGDQFADAMLR